MKLDIKNYTYQDVPITSIWVRQKDYDTSKLELSKLYTILQRVILSIDNQLLFFTYTGGLEVFGFVLTRNANLYAIFKFENSIDPAMHFGKVKLEPDAPYLARINLVDTESVIRLPYKASILMPSVEHRKSIQTLIANYNRISTPEMEVVAMVLIHQV